MYKYHSSDAPVCLNSAHVNDIDVQLYKAMRLVSAAVRPTPGSSSV